MKVLDVAAGAAALAATVPAAMRWLRVAQREHYLPGSATRFAVRWWTAGTPNRAAGTAAVVATAATPWVPPASVVTAAVVAAGPHGLGVRGRTAKLAWTRRLKTLTGVVAVVDVVAVAVPAAFGAFAPAAALVALGQPLVVDAALALAAPLERRSARRFVTQAEARLRAVDPTVVAITGSYGKTTTKGYVRHLLAGSRSVLASPASFNNTAGLSRTMNEHLSPGTDVLVAEMGTYGPGEIASMCEWVRPHVGVITAIGPVHLERQGSLDQIVASKAELLDRVAVAVLNVDAHGLAAVADRVEANGVKVIRCSTQDPAADVVAVDDGTTLRVAARHHGLHVELPRGPHPSNVACALGAALAVGADADELARRLHDLPVADHRHAVSVAPSGVIVIDNTFSSNPASAASSLGLLARTGAPDARRVVVTPGMVELGPVQEEENERFGRAAAAVANDVCIVGRTNAAAIRRGAGTGPAAVRWFATREDAVAWVRANLAAGDVVLYENDLPDHYP